MKNIAIKTSNPVEADRLLQNFGILMEGGGKDDPTSYVKDKKGNYRARSLSDDTSFAKFSVANQGYNFIQIID